MEPEEFRSLIFKRLSSNFQREELIKGGYIDYQYKKALKSKYAKQIQVASIDDKDMVKLADNIITLAKNSYDWDSYKTIEIKGSHDDIKSHSLIKKIEPYLRLARKAIFNSEDPPFKSPLEIRVWAEKEYENQDLEKLKQDAINAFSKGYEARYLFFYDEDDNRVNIQSNYSEKLDVVERACEKISKYSGFSIVDSTMLLLMGKEPKFRRYNVKIIKSGYTLEGCKPFIRVQAEITLNVNDISLGEIKKIYKHYRSVLNVEGIKQPKDKSNELVSFINSLENLPPTKGTKGAGTKAYWESVMEKWNKDYPEYEFKTWEGIMKAYDRAMNKLFPK